MFVDQVQVFVKAGDGGNGIVAFRREKYEPMGGQLVVTAAAAVMSFLK